MGWGKVDVGSPVRVSNPNLLDNWYFADPIDQRQGYVVPPGAAYYSDTGLAAQEGTVSWYTTANYVDGVYGSISVDGATHYVDWSAAVRGYAGKGYAIDRWKTPYTKNINLLLGDGYTRLQKFDTVADHGGYLQMLEMQPTETCTVSILVKKMVGTWYFAGTFMNGNFLINGEGLTSVTILPKGQELLIWGLEETAYIDIIAVKLELGPVQTLAHQDANGNWVLNDPPPNRALELSKCKQYQQPVGDPLVQVLFTESGGYTVVAASFRFPVSMRATPSLSLLSDSLTIYSGTDQIFTIDRIEGYVCDKDGCYFINLWGRFENTQENRAYKSKNLNYIWADANL